MKKTLLCALALLAMTVCTIAQTTTTDGSIVYYMPKTSIVIDVEYEQVISKQGPFYQFSERYLGTKDVVTESGTNYEVKDIHILTSAEADMSRAYSFIPSKATVLSFRLDKNGVLEGINLPAETQEKKTKEKPAKTTTDKPDVMPLMEEQMLASSVAKMAESTAKQIYRIREARLTLVSGEAEQMPADGQSMKMMLKELDKQEAALVALFVGETKRTVMHKKITLTPEVNSAYDNVLLFRFSQFAGPVAADDLSGAPYYITLDPTRVNATNAKKIASPIYYVIPGKALITLTDGENTVAEKSVNIAQFGQTVPLSPEVVRSGATVRFCTKSGALLSIE